MILPTNITKDHLLRAIEKIDAEGIPPDGQSRYYDVIFMGKRYPPKLIISYSNFFANGTILERNSFHGGIGSQGFKLLEMNGFVIQEKEKKKTHCWIEKTLVVGRSDRKEGPRALGKVLWSPEKSKDGKDIYCNMRFVENGDIILHLIDNKEFIGVSIAKETYVQTTGLEGTNWEGPSYLIELENYAELEPPIQREDIFNERNNNELKKIMGNSEVFYTSDFNLRQGAYLTPCPDDLLFILNQIYKSKSQKNIPYINLNGYSIIMESFNYKKIYSDFIENGLYFSDRLILRFVASLITKPFVILTGLSGSGKTKLAHAFAHWISETEGQYCIVPVGADWTNREPLLGFPNALNNNEYIKPDNQALELILAANDDPNRPYFLILDEMNLSHVERYFADFLSVMETNNKISLHSLDKDKVKIPNELNMPKNLFIIGTVNIDETTYMFSPKVLDRANVIEFRIEKDEMEKYLEGFINMDFKSLQFAGASMSGNFLKIAYDNNIKVNNPNEIVSALLEFFDRLKEIGAEFGYRSANEIFRFTGVINAIEKDWHENDIIDAAIMQKLLPKVHGSRRRLAPVLETLGILCFRNEIDEKEKIKEYLNPVNETITIPALKYPLSFDKISRMYRNLINNGFTSYAEA
ncbi:MAG TPA: DUF3578 domain-containing protein [Ignavibacteria bacterium]|nr:DUF3578 domain-containing protein [Ignavibacteria bacterium]HMQ99825.1 DUF3578 domain-containing protein [Ignavibacteria bacterium]